jgi:hypothetical protein
MTRQAVVARIAVLDDIDDPVALLPVKKGERPPLRR